MQMPRLPILTRSNSQYTTLSLGLMIIAQTACSTATEPLTSNPLTTDTVATSAAANNQSNTDPASVDTVENTPLNPSAATEPPVIESAVIEAAPAQSQTTALQPIELQPTELQTTESEALTDIEPDTNTGADPIEANEETNLETVEDTGTAQTTEAENDVIAIAPATMPSTETTATIALNGACDTDSTVLTNTMMVLFNEVRANGQQCGNQFFSATGPLQVDNTLTGVAAGHSADMALNNFFSHTGSDGLSAANRIDNSGYDWSAIGENIAAGQRTIESAVAGWIQSPGHCANIMSGNFTEFGAACVQDANADFGVYWTAVYGKPF